MSFSCGIGDFLAVGQLCWKTYKKCKDSTGNYAQLSNEVGALYNVLKETEELLSQQGLTVEQNARLATCRQGCEDVLKDLDGLLVKYQSLGSKSQRTFDRIGFGMQDVNGVRLRLNTNVSMLDAFNNASSHARLESKLNLLMAEVRSGKREGSVISTQTFDTAAQNDRETWEALRRELEDIGISSEVINEKRHFIVTWFQEAVAMGKLEEEASSHDDDSASSLCKLDDLASTSDCNDVFEQHNPSVMPDPHSTIRNGIKRSMPRSQRSAESTIPPLPSAPKETEPGKVSFTVRFFQTRERAFLEAARLGDTLLLRKLLDKGIHVDIKQTYSSATALHLAAKYGRYRAVRLLLSRGANVNAGDADRATALHQAALKGHAHIILMLLESGAHIESRTFLNKSTALLYAATKSSVQMLLEKGAEINSTDSFGITPLIRAAKDNQKAVVRLLLEKGALISVVDNDGNTALGWAQTRNYKEIVRLLQEAEAQRSQPGQGSMQLLEDYTDEVDALHIAE